MSSSRAERSLYPTTSSSHGDGLPFKHGDSYAPLQGFSELLKACSKVDEILIRNQGNVYPSKNISLKLCHQRNYLDDLDDLSYEGGVALLESNLIETRDIREAVVAGSRVLDLTDFGARGVKSYEFSVLGLLGMGGRSGRGDLYYFLKDWARAAGWVNLCNSGLSCPNHSGNYLNLSHFLWGLWRDVIEPASGVRSGEVESRYSEVFSLRPRSGNLKIGGDRIIRVEREELEGIALKLFPVHNEGWLNLFTLIYRGHLGRWFGKDDRMWFKDSEEVAGILSSALDGLNPVARDIFLSLSFDNSFTGRSFYDAAELCGGMLL